MQGKKTHEQLIRNLERRADSPSPGHHLKPEARQSEFAVSRGGLNQESHHNKHNDPGQSGHKPPKL